MFYVSEVLKTMDNIKIALANTESPCVEIFDGFDINSFDSYGNNILHYLIKGDTSCELLQTYLSALVCLSIDLEARQTRKGKTALHICAQKGRRQLVVKLIEAGAKIDSKCDAGNTPLFDAVYSYSGIDSFIIEFLLENGADPNIENKFGNSPRSMAQEIANYDVKKFFQ